VAAATDVIHYLQQSDSLPKALAYLEDLCHLGPFVEDQCLKAVNAFGSIVIVHATHADPQVVCQDLMAAAAPTAMPSPRPWPSPKPLDVTRDITI
jgi:hypothetical protein